MQGPGADAHQEGDTVIKVARTEGVDEGFAVGWVRKGVMPSSITWRENGGFYDSCKGNVR